MAKEKILKLNIGIIAEIKGDIQLAVDKINEMLRTSEIKINSVKTMILVCARDRQIKVHVYNIT